MPSGIYQITNAVNGKRYIGSAVDLKRRRRDHLTRLHHNQHHNQHLQRAFDKHGEASFLFSVLEAVDDVSRLILREQYYLDTLNPEYNICPTAGSPLGIRHTKEARARMSIAKAGERNPNFGKRLSADQRKKISEALSGRPPSKERLAKISGERSPNYGKHLSVETCAKMSMAHMGHVVSEETRQKLRASWTLERRQAASKRMLIRNRERGKS